MPSNMSQSVRTSGAVLSTNAQIKVNCGFQPAYVWLLNKETVTEATWTAAMPNNSMVRRSGASNVNASYVTTSGIQLMGPYGPVVDTSNEGFTIEPGAPVNPTGSHEIFWLAMRGWGPTL